MSTRANTAPSSWWIPLLAALLGIAALAWAGDARATGGGLDVSKTAAASYTRTYDWTLAKGVSPATQTVGGSTASLDYTVTATKGQPTDSAWTVTGEIEIANWSWFTDYTNVTVTDSFPNATCVLAGGVTKVDVPRRTTVAIDYTCTLNGAPNYNQTLTNTATASWSGGSDTGTKTVKFSQASVTKVHDSVKVEDSFQGGAYGLLGTTSATRTWNYNKQVAVPQSGCTTYANTARLSDGAYQKTDGAEAEVCRPGADLTVTKTAAASFTRTFGWTIDKSVTTPALVTTDDPTATFGYQVQVTKSAGTDSAWQIAGTITVANPNGFEVAGVGVTDSLPGASCAIAGGGTNQAIPANGSRQFAYTCTFGSQPSYGTWLTDTATATWDKGAYKTPNGSAGGTAKAKFTTPTTLVNDTATVADDYDGQGYVDLPGQPISSSQTYTYPRTVDVPAVKCREVPNTARVSFGTQQATDPAAVTVCRLAGDLTVTKTATPGFTRTFGWTIAKSVVGESTIISDQATVPVAYAVELVKDAGTDSAWTVSGQITVANPNSFAVSGVDVTDQLPDASCQVTGGTGASIPAKGSRAFAYTCTFAAKPAYDQPLTNTATATWAKDDYGTPHGSATGTAQATFTAPTTTVNDQVTVTDAFNGGAAQTIGTPSTSTTLDDQATAAVPAVGCTTYDNVARITQTGQSSTATVRVCRRGGDLVVSKTATPSYTRTFTWTITKDADQTTKSTPDDTVDFLYTITATKSAPVDSAWTVTGTITVTNPNTFAVSGVDVTDSLESLGACQVTGGAGAAIPATSSTDFAYTCTFADQPAYDQALTNTATATWDKDAYVTPNGSATGTAPATFTAPTTTVHGQVVVSDSYAGLAAKYTLAERTIDQTTAFTYTRTVDVPDRSCAQVENTAGFVATGDDKYTGSATKLVDACREAQPLAVAKTADASFTRTFGWSIAKSAAPATQTVAEDAASVGYTVTVTKGPGADSAFAVTGQITVTNPNRYDVTDVDVADRIQGGPACTITGGGTGLVVPKKVGAVDGTLVLSYRCELTAKADGVNQVTVSWPAPGQEQVALAAQAEGQDVPRESATATAPFAFGAPTTTVHNAVDVRDAFNNGPAELLEGGAGVDATRVFTYARTVPVPATGCTTYPNTASFAATDDATVKGSADAQAQVCRTEVQVLSPGTPAGTPSTPATPATPAGTPSRPTATRARLSIDKRAPREIAAGQVVRYTIRVRNTSRVAARSVVVTDSVPSQMSLARRATGVRMAGGRLTWRLGTLAPGRSRTVVVSLRLDASARGGRCNVATARAANARQVRDGACSRVVPVATAVQPAVTG